MNKKYENEAMIDLKDRYSSVKYIDEIAFEDWFTIIHFICNKAGFSEQDRSTINEGFKGMLLDSIYNNGKIQNIHQSFPISFCNYLNEFDNIFTVNYDNNLDHCSSINREIYHLHGDFNSPASPSQPNVPHGYEHCFCNGVMSAFPIYKELQIAIDKRKYHSIDKFESISDELHILGLSPNNDGHLFSKLKSEKINKVVVYYADSNQSRWFQESFKQYNIKNVMNVDVFDFWDKML